MTPRDAQGRFIPTFDVEDVAGPRISPDIEDVIKKYGFDIADSTCVAHVDYDFENQEMTVAFQKRGTYRYSGVAFDEYQNFQGAGSRGTYFNLYIKDRYSFLRVA